MFFVGRLPDTLIPPIVSGGVPEAISEPRWVSEPVALAFDLPGTDGLQVGALLDPFRATALSFEAEHVDVSAPVKIGALLTDLHYQPPTLWDRTSEIDIFMPEGAGFSVSETDALNGANRFAVETAAGWEVIGAANVTLIGDQTYRLKTLLRGLNNSDDMMVATIPSGARIVKLDAGLATLPIHPDFMGDEIEVTVTAEGRSGVPATHGYVAAHLRPLSIVHVKTEVIGSNTKLSWIPRNLNDSNELDNSIQIEISWVSGRLTASGTEAVLPIESGSNTPVTLIPIDPIGGAGASKTIIV